ncbi:MAG: CpsD/CapB family tyrosine-protein kinase [Bacteroidota bacterium]|nr:CpsD/CapB family tyrosine-protein kinase [Bacteroidota bacterium]
MIEEKNIDAHIEEGVSRVLIPSVDAPSKAVAQNTKAVMLNPVRRKIVDEQTVAFQYYNSFNYSLLSKDGRDVQLALGITSANPGEGKSLVASNLAVSLTLGYKKKTILVDLSTHHPTLHKTFGAPQGPGLLEALNDGDIHVWQTAVDHLHLLSLGSANGQRGTHGNRSYIPAHYKPRRLGLEQMTAFGDVMTALQEEYEFIIVDMPAMNSEDFPVLFANRLDGILMVVDSTITKRRDVEKVFRRLNERQVLGFILNRIKDDEKEW